MVVKDTDTALMLMFVDVDFAQNKKISANENLDGHGRRQTDECVSAMSIAATSRSGYVPYLDTVSFTDTS